MTLKFKYLYYIFVITSNVGCVFIRERARRIREIRLRRSKNSLKNEFLLVFVYGANKTNPTKIKNKNINREEENCKDII